MSLFRLDPESVLQRVQARGVTPTIRGRGSTVLQGMIAFSLVGVFAYGVWPLWGRWLMVNLGRNGFYGAIALAFIVTAGFALGRLVIGPGALGRFYGLFTLAFVLFSVCWCVVYFTLPGQLSESLGGARAVKFGEIFGNAAGCIPFAVILPAAFGAKGIFLPCWAVLFMFSTLGYHLGEPFHTWYKGAPGMLPWGLFHGAGLGAGLGYILYEAQGRTREALQAARDQAAS